MRCPHIVYRDVLGADAAARLLDYVVAREADFKPASVRIRGKAEAALDYDKRNCLLLRDLGAFRAPIEVFVRGIGSEALSQLGLIEPSFEPAEFEISAHRDGGHFVAHLDTIDRLSDVRVLSCVYYFAANPRRFTGGELRLHGFPNPSASPSTARPMVDVVPETDTLVAFPSWLLHEVRPVQVPSRAWADSRFAINCWLHRRPASRREANIGLRVGLLR
jgi:SM-20-related protein